MLLIIPFPYSPCVSLLWVDHQDVLLRGRHYRIRTVWQYHRVLPFHDARSLYQRLSRSFRKSAVDHNGFALKLRSPIRVPHPSHSQASIAVSNMARVPIVRNAELRTFPLPFLVYSYRCFNLVVLPQLSQIVQGQVYLSRCHFVNSIALFIATLIFLGNFRAFSPSSQATCMSSPA